MKPRLWAFCFIAVFIFGCSFLASASPTSSTAQGGGPTNNLPTDTSQPVKTQNISSPTVAITATVTPIVTPTIAPKPFVSSVVVNSFHSCALLRSGEIR